MREDFFQSLYRIVAGGPARISVDAAVWTAFMADPAAGAKPAAAGIASGPVALTAAGSTGDDETMTLEALRAEVQDCRLCRLCENRANPVFGEGNSRAELMFIGEGPGADEDRTGRPFVGRAGQLLDNMIAAMKFRREEVYIANVVKCRPPGNRAPEPDEAAVCLRYLRQQIALIRPRVIVLLGGVALSFMLKETAGISRSRGKWQSFEGIPVMPTFHPAYLLRQPAAKREAWSDLKQVMKILGKL